MEIREMHLFVQEVACHAGRDVPPQRFASRVAQCSPIRWRACRASDDLEAFVTASVAVGEILVRRALDALGSRTPTAYGKGVLVGAGGDLEQGAAMIHCRIGLTMRTAIRAGKALIPGNAKLAAPGATLDIVLGGTEDGCDYDAMDTVDIRLPAAPRADEIVLADAYATGRPKARIRGASPADVAALVAKLR